MIFVCTQLLKNGREQRRSTSIAFVDLKKAFDTVDRDLLFSSSFRYPVSKSAQTSYHIYLTIHSLALSNLSYYVLLYIHTQENRQWRMGLIDKQEIRVGIKNPTQKNPPKKTQKNPPNKTQKNPDHSGFFWVFLKKEVSLPFRTDFSGLFVVL